MDGKISKPRTVGAYVGAHGLAGEHQSGPETARTIFPGGFCPEGVARKEADSKGEGSISTESVIL
jgi:hypothetical protein